MRRVVAVLGAVLMVGVALLIRGGIDGDDGGGDGSGDRGGAEGVTLLCADELEAVCRALTADGAIEDFTTEPAGDTVDRLADDEDLGADGWLTLDPFPEIAETARQQAGLGSAFASTAPTGRGTGIGIATAPARTDAWSVACDGEDPGWVCVGDVVGEPWGDHGGQPAWREITLGIDAPSSSATGLLVVAQAVGAHLGTDDYAANELQSTDTRRWVRDLTEGLDGDERNTLTTMITQAGSYGAVGALVNAATRAAETERGRGTGVFYAAPMYAAEVVVARPAGAAEDLVDEDALAAALDADDWVEQPDAVPLPDAGTLFTLRDLVS
jgi:hypothetical protein